MERRTAVGSCSALCFNRKGIAFKRNTVCQESIAGDIFSGRCFHRKCTVTGETDVPIPRGINAVAGTLEGSAVSHSFQISTVVDKAVAADDIQFNIHWDIKGRIRGICRFLPEGETEVLHRNDRFLPADKADIVIRLFCGIGRKFNKRTSLLHIVNFVQQCKTADFYFRRDTVICTCHSGEQAEYLCEDKNPCKLF